MTCIEVAPDHNNGTGSATIEAAQDNSIQHTKDTVAGPAMTLHTSHTTNPTQTAAHQATTLKDCSRSHSCPPYQLLKYNTPKMIMQFGIILQLGNQKSHTKWNMKVQIEEPPLDYYSSDDNSNDSGEESQSLN